MSVRKYQSIHHPTCFASASPPTSSSLPEFQEVHRGRALIGPQAVGYMLESIMEHATCFEPAPCINIIACVFE